jgi:FtsH-binding integral membrane protein
MDIGALINRVADSAGDLWFAALIGSFFVMICESAKPKLEEGEEKPKDSLIGLWVSIFSLLTPILLFIHGFVAARGYLIAVVALIGGIVIGAALIGWIIAAAAAPMGRTLNRAAPFLAVAVFALTVFISWRSVYEVFDFYVLSRLR